jgi:C-terminal processing protease CtpA/Prc
MTRCHLRMLLSCGLALRLLGAPAPATAQAPLPVTRLAALARLWGDIKYRHPAFAAPGAPDWDSALVASVPAVRAATTPAEFRRALLQMLAPLGDPATSVTDSATPPTSPSDAPPLRFRLTTDSVLLVQVGDYYSLPGSESQTALQQAIKALPFARAVVLDVRATGPVDPYGAFWLRSTMEEIERRISTVPLTVPGERSRVWYGYAEPSAFSSGQYRTGSFTRVGAALMPARGARDLPSVVLLNRWATVPSGALVRQARGDGLVVVEGDPTAIVTGMVHAVSLREGLVASVRESESVLPDGTSGRVLADSVFPEAAANQHPDHALEGALALARAFHRSARTRPVVPGTYDGPRERSYPEMTVPPPAYRLLALFRFWNTIHFFYPYHRLLGTSWDSVLTEFIPRFEQADDSLSYARVIADLATRLHDSHSYVAGRVYTNQLIGAGYPPIRVRLVEGAPVVTAIYDSVAIRAGIRVGDIVVLVDREPARSRLSRYQALIASSTPQGSLDKASQMFLNGPVGTTVELRLRGIRGERTAILTRRYEDFNTLYHRERTGAVITILPGNVGYVDLDRLAPDQVDSMFERLGRTRAIVFDMRGYPNGTGLSIASRLTSRQPVGAWLETPLLGHGGAEEGAGSAFERFSQAVPPTPGGRWLYRRPTLMLIDERTASQAEHTGLFLRAANQTRFVGSPTTGVDGEIVTVSLPGAITIGFTGQSVRWPDGSEIQRRGLLPDLRVTPTIRGLRTGQDEVLEAARRLALQPAQP